MVEALEPSQTPVRGAQRLSSPRAGGGAAPPQPQHPRPQAPPRPLPDPSRGFLPFPLSPGETWPGAVKRRQTAGEA